MQRLGLGFSDKLGGIQDPDLEEDTFVIVAGALHVVEVVREGKGAARFGHIHIGVDGATLLELPGVGL